MTDIPIFNKKLEDILYKDLQDLIKNKVQESINLDYKEKIDWKGKEIGKDICGFANTEGGILVYGMAEDKKTGLPSNLIPFEKYDKNSNQLVMKRYEDYCLSSINPKAKIEMRFIDDTHDSSKGILIVLVAKSDKFHISNNIFYQRENLQTIPVDYNDIQDRFNNARGDKTAYEDDIENILLFGKISNPYTKNWISQYIISMVNYQNILNSDFNVKFSLLLISYGLGVTLGIIPGYLFSLLNLFDFSKLFYWIGYVIILPLGIAYKLILNSDILIKYLNFGYIFSDVFRIFILFLFIIISIPITVLLIYKGKNIISFRKYYILTIFTKLSSEYNSISFSEFRNLTQIPDDYKNIFDFWEINPNIMEIQKDNKFLILNKILTEKDIKIIVKSLRRAKKKLKKENSS